MPSFHEKVNQQGPDDCWEWTGYRENGYGRAFVTGKSTRTHRLAWEHANGPIPEGAFVLHSCDNRACCNPAHLRVGTHQDNMDDMSSRKRHPGARMPGSTNPTAKLDEPQVEQLKLFLAEGIGTQQQLADIFGVSRSLIGLISQGKLWKHVEVPCAK